MKGIEIPLDKQEDSCTAEAEVKEQGKEQRDRGRIKEIQMPTLQPYCDNTATKASYQSLTLPFQTTAASFYCQFRVE